MEEEDQISSEEAERVLGWVEEILKELYGKEAAENFFEKGGILTVKVEEQEGFSVTLFKKQEQPSRASFWIPFSEN